MSATHSTTHDEHEHGHGSNTSTYITVLATLAFLTGIEIFVPRVYAADHNHTLKMLLLVLLAVGKAMLVAWYFMHLKWERPWVRWVATMPVYMGIAAVLLMLESYYRGPGSQG